MTETNKAPHGKESEGLNNNCANNQTQENNTPFPFDCQEYLGELDFLNVQNDTKTSISFESEEEEQAHFKQLHEQSKSFIERVYHSQHSYFIIESAGLFFVEEPEGKERSKTRLCSHFKILGQTRNADSVAWGLFLEWRDPDGYIHKWAMPKALLVGKDVSAWLGRLVDEGLQASQSPKHKNLLATFLNTYQCKNSLLCVDSTGWHNGVFVFPFENIKKTVARVARVARLLRVTKRKRK